MRKIYYPQGFCAPCKEATHIYPFHSPEEITGSLGQNECAWLQRQNFRAKPAQWCFFPHNGASSVALGVKNAEDWRSWADAALTLPKGHYQTTHLDSTILRGWGSGSYRYNSTKRQVKLCCPNPNDSMLFLVRAERLTRFLIDHPANKLTPARLSKRAQKCLLPLASDRILGVQEVVGQDLRKQNFPLIFSVGQASCHAPRLVDMSWHSPHKNPEAPLITLIGKGITFDTGGLDIKPRQAMLSMKKDMGGAAHAIGLAAMILSTGLPVRLRLILGIAENAIGGNAMRPGDILRARNGSTIEIGDTDAEGRLVLADCLSLAGEQKSAILIDFATLTGAARVALGADLPAVFCNDDPLALALTQSPDDPLWRLPLHHAYASELTGSISTLNSAPGAGYGGAITAALFLEHFAPQDTPWAHIDLMAYAPKKIHGRPSGAAAQGLYACLKAISALC